MPSLQEDVAAAVDALGVEKVGLIWGIGNTDWKDADERDQFIKDITGKG